MAPLSLWLYRALMAVSLPLLAPFLLVADRRRGAPPDLAEVAAIPGLGQVGQDDAHDQRRLDAFA